MTYVKDKTAEAALGVYWGDWPVPEKRCTHERKQLLYIGAALEEWYCLDCPAKIRVWSSSP